MRGKTHLTIGVLGVIQASILFNKPISLLNVSLFVIFNIT